MLSTAETQGPTLERDQSFDRDDPHQAELDSSSTTPKSPGTIDLSDIERFRLPQDFRSGMRVEKLLTKVPVRKPAKQEFVRVHPDESYRMDAPLLIWKENDEHYVVGSDVRDDLYDETVRCSLFTTTNRQGVVFLWPIRMPNDDGTHNSWHASALDAAQRAMKDWVRVQSNRGMAAYEISLAMSKLPEPNWPDKTFGDIFNIAFRHCIIDRLDHPIVKQLQGG